MATLDQLKRIPFVQEFIENKFEDRNVLLYADGGCGKTTTMKCLNVYLLDNSKNGEKIVPLYIQIKQIDEFSNRPLLHYIYTHYSGTDTKEEDVETLFTEQAPVLHDKYTFYLLIDGYNEVPLQAKWKINQEIRWFKEKKNVRLVISSRINEEIDVFNGFIRCALGVINDEQLLNYLGKKFEKDICIDTINQNLLRILRIPLYLNAFSKTYSKTNLFPELANDHEIRKADILDNFIYHSLKKLHSNESIDDLLAEFVLLYFMPALAFEMYKNNSFTISLKKLDKFSCDLDYFSSLLDLKQRGRYLSTYRQYRDAVEQICCDNLAIMQRIDADYEIHNIYRDYFVAKHIINCMNFEKLDDLEISIDANIREFVGELIREYKSGCGYSKDYMDKSDAEKARKSECDFEEKDNLEEWPESPIEHFMQQHNTNSEKPISTIATRNLIEVMKTCRNNNIIANYFKLDLTNSSFCATKCCNSNFRETRISSSTFSSYLDNISMDFVSISADNKLIIIVDEVIYKAIVLDINTGAVIKNFDYLDWRDDYCLYGRKPIFFNEDDCAQDYEIIETIQYENRIYKIYFEEISNCVDYYDNFDVEIIEDSTFVLTNHGNATIKTTYHDNKVSVISFSRDGNRLISGNEQGIINIWKIEGSKNVYEPLYSLVTDSEVKSISVSDDNSYMITVHKNGEIIVWDYSSLKIKNIYVQRSFPSLTSYFIHKNNNCIVLCYCEYGHKLTMLIYDLKYKRIVKGFNKSINGYYVVSSVCNKCAYIDNNGFIHIFDYILDNEIIIKTDNSMILKKSYILNFSPDGTYISLKKIYMQDDNLKITKYLIFDLNLRKCIFILNEGDCVNVDSLFYFIDGEWKTFTDNDKTPSLVDAEYASFLFQYKDDHYLAYENAENQIFQQIGYIIPAIITGSDFHNVKLDLNNKQEFLKTLFINGGEVDGSFYIKSNYDNLKVQSRKNIRFNTDLVNVFTDNIKEKHIIKYALSEYFIDGKIYNKHCHFILNKLERIFGCDNVFYYVDALFIINNFKFQIHYLPCNLKVLNHSVKYYSSSNELVFVATGEKNYIVTFSLDLKQFRLIHIHKKYLSLFIYDYLLQDYIEIRNFCVDNGIEYLYGTNLKELSFYIFEIIDNQCIELIIQKLEFDYFINIYIERSHVYFIEKKENGLFNIKAIISNEKIEHEYTFKITDIYLENQEKTTYYLTLKGDEYKYFFGCESKMWGFANKEIRFDSRKKELYLYNNQTD